MQEPNQPWTAKDEALHRESIQVLAMAQMRRQAAVSRLNDALNGTMFPDGDGIDVQRVIAKADALRDALAPFDSGVRVGKA